MMNEQIENFVKYVGAIRANILTDIRSRIKMIEKELQNLKYDSIHYFARQGVAPRCNMSRCNNSAQGLPYPHAIYLCQKHIEKLEELRRVLGNER